MSAMSREAFVKNPSQPFLLTDYQNVVVFLPPGVLLSNQPLFFWRSTKDG
ncbi:hypothetical protein Plhal304r1_c071g0160121 [Plasmopara halstedii]